MSDTTRNIQLADIPAARVRRAVEELLDVPDLNDVQEVSLGIGVLRAVVLSRDDNGRLFADGNNVATHTITRKVVGP